MGMEELGRSMGRGWHRPRGGGGRNQPGCGSENAMVLVLESTKNYIRGRGGVGGGGSGCAEEGADVGGAVGWGGGTRGEHHTPLLAGSPLLGGRWGRFGVTSPRGWGAECSAGRPPGCPATGSGRLWGSPPAAPSRWSSPPSGLWGVLRCSPHPRGGSGHLPCLLTAISCPCGLHPELLCFSSRRPLWRCGCDPAWRKAREAAGTAEPTVSCPSPPEVGRPPPPHRAEVAAAPPMSLWPFPSPAGCAWTRPWPTSAASPSPWRCDGSRQPPSTARPHFGGGGGGG